MKEGLKELYEIADEAKGLKGFVRAFGGELEKKLVDKFDGRAKKPDIGIKYTENCPLHFFQLFWFYNAPPYDFSGVFSLNKQDDSFELAIERSPGVIINNNYNWVGLKASPTELRVAADMEDSVIKFLQKKFGDPLRLPESGGRLIYRPFYLPEEFRLEDA